MVIAGAPRTVVVLVIQVVGVIPATSDLDAIGALQECILSHGGEAASYGEDNLIRWRSR
jgi:hypothetical protein